MIGVVVNWVTRGAMPTNCGCCGVHYQNFNSISQRRLVSKPDMFRKFNQIEDEPKINGFLCPKLNTRRPPQKPIISLTSFSAEDKGNFNFSCSKQHEFGAIYRPSTNRGFWLKLKRKDLKENFSKFSAQFRKANGIKMSLSIPNHNHTMNNSSSGYRNKRNIGNDAMWRHAKQSSQKYGLRMSFPSRTVRTVWMINRWRMKAIDWV